MATMIKAEHLTFCYPDEPADHPPVLDDVNLEIEAGSFVAILGHNGSGKSTLAKHMNALLTPTAGKLWVEGLDTADPENLLAVRGKVGHGLSKPGQPDCGQRGGGGRGLRPGKSGGCRRRRSGSGWTTRSEQVGMYEYRATTRPICSPGARSSGWPSPASLPCMPTLHCAGRAHRHAGPSGPAGGRGHHPDG